VKLCSLMSSGCLRKLYRGARLVTEGSWSEPVRGFQFFPVLAWSENLEIGPRVLEIFDSGQGWSDFIKMYFFRVQISQFYRFLVWLLFSFGPWIPDCSLISINHWNPTGNSPKSNHRCQWPFPEFALNLTFHRVGESLAVKFSSG